MRHKITVLVAILVIAGLGFLTVRQYNKYKLKQQTEAQVSAQQLEKLFERNKQAQVQLQQACKRGEVAYDALTLQQKAKIAAPQCAAIVQ